MLDLRSLLLLAIPGQLMVLSAGVLIWLAGFGWVSLLPTGAALVTVSGLGLALRAGAARTGAVVAGLVASSAGLVLTASYAWLHLAAAAGLWAALMVTLLALGAFGPAIVALGLALRR